MHRFDTIGLTFSDRQTDRRTDGHADHGYTAFYISMPFAEQNRIYI